MSTISEVFATRKTALIANPYNRILFNALLLIMGLLKQSTVMIQLSGGGTYSRFWTE